jgi:hypothetical protein
MELKSHLNVEGFLEIAFLVNKLNKPLSIDILKGLSELGKLDLSKISLELSILNKNLKLRACQTLGEFLVLFVEKVVLPILLEPEKF